MDDLLSAEPTELEIEALKKAHPHDELHLIESGGRTVVAKGVRRPEYERFMATLQDDDKVKAMEIERLTRRHVVWPSPETFDKALETLPGLGQTFGNRLIKLAGLQKEATSKKL